MRMFWGDYFRDTRGLNRHEHSAYLILLGEMWVKGGKLPADDETLARLTLCTPKEWAAVKPRVMAFFKIKRGWMTQKRLAAELANYVDTIGKRKRAGKISSNVRRGKGTGSSATHVEHVLTEPEPEPESGLEAYRKASNSTRRERPEARHEGASVLRVIEGGGEADAWRKALAEAQHDLPHFVQSDPDFASEIAEFIDVALEKLAAMELAA